jgi:putative redox protein
MRQDVTGYQLRVEGDRSDQHPKVYASIRVEHVIVGNNLKPERIHRAVEKSATRYCPASAMLKKAARIEEFVRIIDETNDEEMVGPLQLSEAR